MKVLRYLSAFWGALGVSMLLLMAISRVGEMLLNAAHIELTGVHIVAFVVSIILMAYSEGYRGFQLKFSPRVAARILYLSKDANCINGMFAPFFCMGYFGTTRKRQVTAILVSSFIALLVRVVREVPQPWRAVIDAGVIVGLAWGIISLWVYIWLAFSRHHFPYSPELPTNDSSGG